MFTGLCRSCWCGLPHRSITAGAFWPTGDGSAVVSLFCVTDERGLAVSEKERENSEVLLFFIFE